MKFRDFVGPAHFVVICPDFESQLLVKDGKGITRDASYCVLEKQIDPDVEIQPVVLKK